MYCFIFNGGTWTIDYVLKALAKIITRNDHFSKQDKYDNYDYMIGTHNDWWVNVHEDTRNFEVYHRYHVSDLDCQALQRSICFLLGVSKDNGYNNEGI